MSFKAIHLGKTQEQHLLDHFKKHGQITSYEARDLYRIQSLTRRIATLRQADHLISSTVRYNPIGQKYVRYVYLGKKPSVEAQAG